MGYVHIDEKRRQNTCQLHHRLTRLVASLALTSLTLMSDTTRSQPYYPTLNTEARHMRDVQERPLERTDTLALTVFPSLTVGNHYLQLPRISLSHTVALSVLFQNTFHLSIDRT